MGYAKADEWTGLRIPHDVSRLPPVSQGVDSHGANESYYYPTRTTPANGGWVIRVTGWGASRNVELVKMCDNQDNGIHSQNIDPEAQRYEIYYDTGVNKNVVR